MTICELGASYAVDDKRRALEKLADAGCPHRFFEYDWSLNQTPR